jgi:Fe-S cluster biogenesis protein NfuA/nitrite reductase/ring-hydroxylating ferredoxin subunit
VDDERARERVARVEELLDELEGLGDPQAAAKATELVQALLDLYGEGLARVMEHAAHAGATGFGEALAGDELVSHLLLLHDLHPMALEERVRGALEEVRPYLDSHGGGVELVAVEDAVVHLRMEGSCDGCPSSAATLKLAIEDAIHRAAPEIEEVRAEGAVRDAPAPVELPLANGASLGAVPLPVTGNGAGPPPATTGAHAPTSTTAWETAGALPELANGGTALKRVGGEELLFLKLGDAPYAYRPRCPACGGSLADGSLAGSALTCPGCGRGYDVRRAGRPLDGDGAALEPVPLLTTDAGLVKVALPAAAV